MGAPKQSGHWTGFRAVLCSIDFSDQARLALRYAEVVVLWAKVPGAKEMLGLARRRTKQSR